MGLECGILHGKRRPTAMIVSCGWKMGEHVDGIQRLLTELTVIVPAVPVSKAKQQRQSQRPEILDTERRKGKGSGCTSGRACRVH